MTGVLVRNYGIEDDSCHYKQWRSDVITNRAVKTDFYKTNPDFKKKNPGIRWLTATEPVTYANTQKNQKIRILRVTLPAEAAAFLGLLKKKTGHHRSGKPSRQSLPRRQCVCGDGKVERVFSNLPFSY